MSLSYIWPIILVVTCNVFYQIFAKSVPKNMDIMASMTITYLTAAFCSAIMYFVMNKGGNLFREYHKLNISVFLLGVSVVGLEAGFIYTYRAGWPVSTSQTVQSVFLALALIFVGGLVYHEAITPNQIIGIIICLVGLYFINK